MSIQDTGALTYSDHEIQWIRNDLRFRDAADAGPTTDLSIEDEFNITERGLDNDELAELVYLRADLAFGAQTVGDQTTNNISFANTDWGVNTVGTENLLTDANSEFFDVDDSGTDDFVRRFRTTDEAGELVSETLRSANGYTDTAGYGANHAFDRVQVEIDLRETFGSGPFLDSTDDLVNKIFMSVENAIDACELTQRLMLAYDVDTVEGTRASFGRP